jgi:hypothetical protein
MWSVLKHFVWAALPNLQLVSHDLVVD